MGELIAFRRPEAGMRGGLDMRASLASDQPCMILFFTGVWRERMTDPSQGPKRSRQGAAKRSSKGRGKSKASQGERSDLSS